jgi:hypothetical protein
LTSEILLFPHTSPWDKGGSDFPIWRSRVIQGDSLSTRTYEGFRFVVVIALTLALVNLIYSATSLSTC